MHIYVSSYAKLKKKKKKILNIIVLNVFPVNPEQLS